MAVGDFSSAQEAEIDRAIRGAETACRFEFSVFVGPTPGDSRDVRAAGCTPRWPRRPAAS